MSASPFKILFVIVTVNWQSTGAALLCADSERGTCEVEGSRDFCSVNITAGTFDCDSNKECDKIESIRGRSVNTCVRRYKQNVEDLCCCNAASQEGYGAYADFCNYISVKHLKERRYKARMNAAFWCDGWNEAGTNRIRFGNCADVYCTNFMYRRVGEISVNGYVRSCQSWMYHSLEAYKKGSPAHLKYDGYGMLKEQIVNDAKYRCAELMQFAGEQNTKGVKSVCTHKEFKFRDVDYEARYCCCTGADYCNSDISWHQSVDYMTEFKMSIGANIETTIWSVIVSLILILCANH